MLRGETHFAADLAFVTSQFSTVSVGNRDYSMVVQVATPNYLDVIGVKPILGRWFDSTAGPAGAVVLSQGTWRFWFPKQTSLEGASIRINDRTYSVVGVLPAEIGSVWLAAPVERADTSRFGGQTYARLKRE